MCHALTVAKLCFDTAARLQARVTRGERFILFRFAPAVPCYLFIHKPQLERGLLLRLRSFDLRLSRLSLGVCRTQLPYPRPPLPPSSYDAYLLTPDLSYCPRLLLLLDNARLRLDCGRLLQDDRRMRKGITR